MQRRNAFTLVEMLVAMALTLFIMVIISSAFVTGLDTFRGLKGIGDLQANLRTVSVRLRSDLMANHFDGKKRLSDPGFWTDAGRPREGFFALALAFPAPESVDEDGIPSYRAQHILHFTIKLRGPRAEDLVTSSTPLPGLPPSTQPEEITGMPGRDVRHEAATSTAYNSQWAEVAYFLAKTGTTDFPTNPSGATGVGLYDLYRVQRALVPTDVSLEGKYDNATYPQWKHLSCAQGASGKVTFFTPEEVAQSSATRGFQLATANPATPGASLMLSNVVSFQVEPLVHIDGQPQEQFDFLTIPAAGLPFDTARTTSPGYRVTALRITIRVWDSKTEQARQITIVQDL